MNKKILLSSLMSIAMLASITTGATYALFTAEDTVNVNVTAGKVSVTANVLPTFYVKSLDTELKEVIGEGEFSTGGKVTVDKEGNITLDRIVPGDKVVFDVEIKNESNIDVNYRSVVAVTEGLELFSGLKVTVDNQEYNGMTAYSKWEYLTPGTGNRTVRITIELPSEASNEYQELSTKITYTVNAVQGNSSISNVEEDVTYIYTENDLRLLAMDVNRGNSYKNEVIKLMQKIDLGNREWTPIGTSMNNFKGIFDGQNYTISNLNVGEESKSNIGLFGYTTDGSIKNVHVHNADVDGRLNVGVVAGTPYTSTYSNIKVTGNVTVDGMAYVGGVLGKNVYADVTNVTVDVDEGSYVNANSVENETAYRTYVGGVIGFMGEGNHTVSNVTSNIDVIGSTCDIGGITGIAHYNNTFVNCFSSGDVTQTSYEGDNLEIGGIAGVWHNENNTTVTLDKCVYTGTLKVNGYTGSLDEYVLTGSKYSTSGTGTLNVISYTKASNETEIRNALSTKENVELTSDVKATAQAGGYNKTGLVINGQYFDGNGYELNVKDAGSTWDSAIYTTGGTIRNLTVSGAMRGIFTAGQNSNIIIDNVTFKDVIYTFNSDDGNRQYSVYISNSTLNGWTSYSNVHKEVSFTNCSFGEGSGYAFLRPYNASSFANCTFSEGYELDSTKATKGTLVMTNCYVGNTKITQANITELLGSSASNVIVK